MRWNLRSRTCWNVCERRLDPESKTIFDLRRDGIGWDRISQHLEAKKATLAPATYKKLSAELMSSRTRMSDGTGRMDREKYYGFAEGELKKIEQIDSQIK